MIEKVELNPDLSKVAGFESSKSDFYHSIHAILLTPDNSVVLVKENGQDFFNLPGGRPLERESPEETLRRELRTQIGADPDTIYLGYLYMQNNIRFGIFIGRTSPQDMFIPEAEIQEDQIDEIRLIPFEDFIEGLNQINPQLELPVKNAIEKYLTAG